jgi:RNA-directed DNA polymerase
MKRECHVRFCESGGVRLPSATRLICPCRSRKEAQALKAALEVRMEQCHLQLHPEKTRVVFCRDGNRRVDYEVFHFDFLGYRFRPPGCQIPGRHTVHWVPPGAISPKATKAIRRTIRRWRLHCWHTVALVDVAREINPVLRGWVTYYGRFQRSALHTVFDSLDRYLERWLRRKYKRLKYKVSRAREMLRQIRRGQPALFAHWALAAHGGQ